MLDKVIELSFIAGTVILSTFLTYYFTKKSTEVDSARKHKEESYINLILHLNSFHEKYATTKNKEIFFQEYYKSWAYASDEVITCINKLIESVKNGKVPTPEEGQKLIANIIIAVRKDLKVKSKIDPKVFEYIKVGD